MIQPFNIATMVMVLKNTLSLSIYKWYSFVTSLFSWTSFFGIVAISLDRLLAIQLHLRYQELVTEKRVTAVVISIWVFSTILSLIISFQLIPADDKTGLIQYFSRRYGTLFYLYNNYLLQNLYHCATTHKRN